MLPKAKPQKNAKGFSLIELMVVIAIISILAAIAIPNFIAYRDKTYCTYAEQDAQSVFQAIASYFSEPQRIKTPSLADLQRTESLSTTNEGSANITITENIGKEITIEVKDASQRCPKGESYVFSKTLGGEQGSWQ